MMSDEMNTTSQERQQTAELRCTIAVNQEADKEQAQETKTKEGEQGPCVGEKNEDNDRSLEQNVNKIIGIKNEGNVYELEEGELYEEEEEQEKEGGRMEYADEKAEENGNTVEETSGMQEEEKLGNNAEEELMKDTRQEEKHTHQMENGAETESRENEKDVTLKKVEESRSTGTVKECAVASTTAVEIITVKDEKQDMAFKTPRYFEVNDDTSSSDESDVLEVHGGSGSDSETEKVQVSNRQLPQKKPAAKTYGEISLEDLPPIEKLQITVGDDVKLVEVGEVLHSVGVLVVVESKPNLPPLDADTVLFLEGKQVLGQVFDTIGQVCRPCYAIRFNRESDIEEQGIKSGMRVFYAPHSEEWTHYVFLAHLMKIRGSDASWEHDNEPPPQFLDYSDDEAERRAKAKLRGRNDDKEEEDADIENKALTKKKKVPTATLR